MQSTSSLSISSPCLTLSELRVDPFLASIYTVLMQAPPPSHSWQNNEDLSRERESLRHRIISMITYGQASPSMEGYGKLMSVAIAVENQLYGAAQTLAE